MDWLTGLFLLVFKLPLLFFVVYFISFNLLSPSFPSGSKYNLIGFEPPLLFSVMLLFCITTSDSGLLKFFFKNVGVTGILDFLRVPSLVDSVPPTEDIFLINFTLADETSHVRCDC